MIEQFIGEGAFRQGVGNYLREHAYDNTVTADLWAGLDSASGQPVGEIMDTWILQRGFPQLEVVPSGNGIKISQRRYLTIPDESDQTLWQVPVQTRQLENNAATEKFLLKDVETERDFESAHGVIVNAGGHGFYRVRYEDRLFSALVDKLSSLDDLERFMLVDDTWAFVESGQQSSTDYLRLVSAYRDETEPAIWGAVLGGVAAIGHHLVDDDHRQPFAKWVSELVGPAFSRLGWEPQAGETDLTRRLRGQLIGALGRLAEDDEVIARSRKLVELIIEDSRSIDPEIARASLFVTAAYGSETEYRRFFEQYKTTTVPHEQQRWLLALSAFDEPDLVVETVDASLDGRIRTQDSAWVIGATLGNRRNGHMAWQELRRRWDTFVKLPTMTQRRMVEAIPALSRPEVAAEVEAFFAETPLPHAAKSVAQNLERLRANVLLKQRETEAVARFLEV